MGKIVMSEPYRGLNAALARSAAPAERFAAVLGLHEMVGMSVPAGDDHDCRLITNPHDGCGCTRIIVGCTGCDWQGEADGTQGDAHRAHVGAALAVVADDGLAERVRALADRWEARADDFLDPVPDMMRGHATRLRALLTDDGLATWADEWDVRPIIRERLAKAWDEGRAAERRDWEFTFDISTPDEDRQPWANPYRVAPSADRDERDGA